MSSFDDRWKRLAQAARHAPADPPVQLDVARILAARRARPGNAEPRLGSGNRHATIPIGWLPPSLAAAALIAVAALLATGFDPLEPAGQAAGFVRDLPSQVPHAPPLAPPFAVPSPTPWLASVHSAAASSFKDLMP